MIRKSNIYYKALLLCAFVFLFADSMWAQSRYQWKTASSGGYDYRYVSNDPTQSRFYTLKNGLTVILSKNTKQPRIQTYIATKAGSKTDPKEHTGLAHYLEHMLFKGTDKYGSLDWNKEKPLLDQIYALYEKYNHSTDSVERNAIYKQIDLVSGEASKFALPNEYDKLMSNMGAKGSNAFTSFEQTVYIEDIPNNVIDKYLSVQAERFRNPVLRLFHTELESVYEEKNISLDKDDRKVSEAMFEAIFPNNNYGKQTVLGSVEHLKNPSLKAIQHYYETYYVPNNMAIIMSGDFDPNEVIRRVDDAFGYMISKPVPEYIFEKEQPITHPVSITITGPSAEYLTMGFRFPGAASADAEMLSLVASMLSNGAAGLIDINLVKSQKLLGADAYPQILKDYSILTLQGNPIEGQTLDDVKKLLLAEIHKLQNGDFSEDLIISIVNNEKKSELRKRASSLGVVYDLLSSFTSELDWANEVGYTERLSKITKKDIMQFANKYLSDRNYIAVYKRQGIDTDVVKVIKPAITPITVNQFAESGFLKQINAMPEQPIQPRWIDFNQDISKFKLRDLDVLAVTNQENELFNLSYQFDVGQWDNKLLDLAIGYLEFLGTKTRSSEKFSREFYKLASDFSVSAGDEESMISISGLNSNFNESVDLLRDLLHHCVADEAAFNSYIDRLKKMRENAKENKGAIMEGLKAYAQYGEKNPFNFTLTDAELDALKAEDLVAVLHNLVNVKPRILYYGPQPVNELMKNLKPLKNNNSAYYKMDKGEKFKEKPTVANMVLFAHYPMKQTEVFWIRNTGIFDRHLMPEVAFFNGYFGGGIGSIVFQTLRESKALAYSTYAYYGQPQKKENYEMMSAYIGTQSDKFKDAVNGMNTLLNELPESKVGVASVRENLLKSLASERITGASILSSYLQAQRRGLSEDPRRAIFEKISTLTYNDLKVFHADKISHKPYVYCIVGDENGLKESDISSVGNIKKVSLSEIFGY
ncbi:MULTISPECIES: M16 family metallopeptidase [unclassified Sphingobacterium]|uniref:M16 family metallopeptidase n=1 Tax=unclassified Sphingobacterium TaxID=2609468 RepID=UPI0025E5DF23|nr:MULTISPECIES: M16 family metallopeptidase [unclassified Sphingobacterium]